MSLKDGITEVAAGKIAAVHTYLEMHQRPDRKPVQSPEGLALKLHDAPDVSWYRDLYRLVGADYLWFSRLEMEVEALAAHLAQDSVEIWSVQKDGRDLGLLELEWQDHGDCELSFFGLSDELIGSGVGRWLMEHALDRAFGRGIKRFFVHTCTLDSAPALRFYVRSGFVPYGRAIEIAEDPRLNGVLSADCAPQIPLIR